MKNSNSRDMSSASESRINVICPSCHAENRVDPSHAGQPVCGRCRESLSLEATGFPVDVTDATFAALVLGSPVPVLVDLWAAWCGPCRAMAPVFDAVAREMAGRMRFARLNVDDNPRTAAKLGVQSIPTLVLHAGGREVKRQSGSLSPEALRAFIARVH